MTCVFLAVCEAAPAGMEHGLGALAPYPQNKGLDPPSHNSGSPSQEAAWESGR